MNRAQLPQSTEPTGAGIRWCVSEILRPRVYEPVIMAAEVAIEPSLRSATSVRLWEIICAATEPLEKAAWMTKAGLRGKIFRARGSSTIINLRDNGWITEDCGYFTKAHRG